MSEIGRDVARAAERAGEAAQQVLGGFDKAYGAAKTANWAELGTLVGAISIAVFIIYFAIVIVPSVLDRIKTDVKHDSAQPRPAFGSPDYLDWANREGKYAPPEHGDVR